MTVHRKGGKLEANLEKYVVYIRLFLFLLSRLFLRYFFFLFARTTFQTLITPWKKSSHEEAIETRSKYQDTMKYTVAMHLAHPHLKLSPKTLAERKLSSFYFTKFCFIGFMSQAHDCIKSHNLDKHISDSTGKCCKAVVQTLVLISEAINAIKKGTFANQIMECP